MSDLHAPPRAHNPRARYLAVYATLVEKSGVEPACRSLQRRAQTRLTSPFQAMEVNRGGDSARIR